ncbi:transmembrane protein [Ditylenchus destructor]|uniref:Transmembrane protein n=1 Tax=Ditylenchus destructor TaxID=166010 RepID=A0AAD4NK98_9BILA|nr:transmembrane protein [Ditylenchus destructor]
MAVNPQFMHDWWAKWSSRVRSAFSRDGIEASSSRQNLVENAVSSHARTTTSDYTELNGGSVPCPSCNGSGLIPKELESTLVALIPVNDERLKPKRTWLYISIWIMVCIIIGGVLLFLFMPRTVVLNSNEVPIEIVHVYDRDNATSTYIDFYFLNTINVSSGNYLPVSVLNITATIISKFQPWSMDVVGYGENDTFSQTTPLDLYRNTRELSFNNTVSLKGFAA